MEVFDSTNRQASKLRVLTELNDSIRNESLALGVPEEDIPNILTNPEKAQNMVDLVNETIDEVYNNIKSEIETKGYIEVKEYTLVGGLLQETIVKKPIILDGNI